MNPVIKVVIGFLKNRAVWVGAAAIATAVGVSLSPELVDTIASAGVSIATALGTFFGV